GSRFRRDLCEDSRPLLPFLVAYLFIWYDKYFRQPLPQIVIDRGDPSAAGAFFSNALRNTTVLKTALCASCMPRSCPAAERKNRDAFARNPLKRSIARRESVIVQERLKQLQLQKGEPGEQVLYHCHTDNHCVISCIRL